MCVYISLSLLSCFIFGKYQRKIVLFFLWFKQDSDFGDMCCPRRKKKLQSLLVGISIGIFKMNYEYFPHSTHDARTFLTVNQTNIDQKSNWISLSMSFRTPFAVFCSHKIMSNANDFVLLSNRRQLSSTCMLSVCSTHLSPSSSVNLLPFLHFCWWCCCWVWFLYRINYHPECRMNCVVFTASCCRCCCFQ